MTWPALESQLDEVLDTERSLELRGTYPQPSEMDGMTGNSKRGSWVPYLSYWSLNASRSLLRIPLLPKVMEAAESRPALWLAWHQILAPPQVRWAPLTQTSVTLGFDFLLLNTGYCKEVNERVALTTGAVGTSPCTTRVGICCALRTQADTADILGRISFGA